MHSCVFTVSERDRRSNWDSNTPRLPLSIVSIFVTFPSFLSLGKMNGSLVSLTPTSFLSVRARKEGTHLKFQELP